MREYHGYVISKEGKVFNKHGKKLKHQKNSKGYPVIGLRINGKSKTISIHRLLAILYLPNPENFSDVDHIDGDRENYSLSNLRWISHGDNIKHSYKLGNRSAIGVNNGRSILTEEEVHEICLLLSKGYKSKHIRDMGYPYVLTQRIKDKRTWKHISKDYEW